MKITPDIIKAIHKYLFESKTNQVELAKKLGVTVSAVNNWLNLCSNSIKDKYWNELEPLIHPYLPSNYFNIQLKDSLQRADTPEGLKDLLTLIENLPPEKKKKANKALHEFEPLIISRILKSLREN